MPLNQLYRDAVKYEGMTSREFLTQSNIQVNSCLIQYFLRYDFMDQAWDDCCDGDILFCILRQLNDYRIEDTSPYGKTLHVCLGDYGWWKLMVNLYSQEGANLIKKHIANPFKGVPDGQLT